MFYNRTLNAYSFSVETTSLKRILDVRVWPWYTMGSPSLPSQQSTSTQRQPLFKALCANAANKIRSVVQSQFCLVEPSQIWVHKFACLPWTKLVTQENGGGGVVFQKLHQGEFGQLSITQVKRDLHLENTVSIWQSDFYCYYWVLLSRMQINIKVI